MGASSRSQPCRKKCRQSTQADDAQHNGFQSHGDRRGTGSRDAEQRSLKSPSHPYNVDCTETNQPEQTTAAVYWLSPVLQAITSLQASQVRECMSKWASIGVYSYVGMYMNTSIICPSRVPHQCTADYFFSRRCASPSFPVYSHTALPCNTHRSRILILSRATIWGTPQVL